MLSNKFEIDISSSKLTNYLLNLQHPDGLSKAKFFRQHGFSTEGDVKTLLIFIITHNAVSETIETEYGIKYIVEGSISSGHAIMLRTVWIVLKGENICRFVTAYPL